MDTIQAIILGAVQGITEFLPISSSAHLVLTPYFLNWKDPGLAYDVALHMGTLAAIFLFFWRDWLNIAKDPLGKRGGLTLQLLVLGTIPGALAGLALEKHAEETFRAPILIAITLTVFALLLYYWDRRGKKERGVESVTIKDVMIVGAAQAIALIPGVSRSGITITAGLALGLTRPGAARLSFLLAAPITAGAGIVKAKHILPILREGGPMASAIGVGFMSSLFAGMAAIGLLNYIIKSRSFNGFVAYRILLSLVIIVIIVINR